MLRQTGCLGFRNKMSMSDSCCREFVIHRSWCNHSRFENGQYPCLIYFGDCHFQFLFIPDKKKWFSFARSVQEDQEHIYRHAIRLCGILLLGADLFGWLGFLLKAQAIWDVSGGFVNILVTKIYCFVDIAEKKNKGTVIKMTLIQLIKAKIFYLALKKKLAS